MRAFRLAYDGTGYRGFQRQPHSETVENALFSALASLGVVENAPPRGYAAAGRTDAGVSARAQTVAFVAPEWLTPRALNGELPPDVRAWAHADVDEGFHATHDAIERRYRYFHYDPDLDDDVVETVCGRLSGTRSFHNLTPDDSGVERTISVERYRDGAFLVVDCTAGGFPRQLVRRVVSLLVSVASGERPVEFVDRVLGPEPIDGPEGVAPAPPEPLVLLDVRYPEASFVVDERGRNSAREVFGARRRERLATARVADTIADPR